VSEQAGAEGGFAGGDTDIPAAATYRITLPEFEGPLDLLLHLCKTHEIDIVSLPVAFITEKYLEYLETMQAMSVEIAAEYLVMAATLAFLKSRELVPSPEPLEAASEDGETEELDPREQLIRQLLEYQKYKDAAAQLGERPVEGRNVFGRGAPVEGREVDAGLAEHSVWSLIAAFADIVKNAEPKATHEVGGERVSIVDRIHQILDRLETDSGTVRFDELVGGLDGSEAEVRDRLVGTLLAILELAKLRVIRVLQDLATEVFFIARREGASFEEARRIHVTSEASAPTEGDTEEVALALDESDTEGMALPDAGDTQAMAADVAGSSFGEDDDGQR
jgi:segregation and condensation protein A